MRTLLVTILLCSHVPSILAEDAFEWPRWRGPHDNGSTEQGTFPVNFDGTTIAWKAPLPGKGCSTPVVTNDMILVTAPIGGQDAVLSFDAAGKENWRVVYGKEVAGRHNNGSGSNASPTTDGEAVFVYFKSGTLAAIELNGDKRWSTNLVERYGKVNIFWDHGTSPILTENHVIMVRMHEGESWVAAFDKQTGDVAWKVPRNYQTRKENDHGYTTPLLRQHNGRDVILVWGAEHLTMHDIEDGSMVWTCGNFNPGNEAMWPAIATPVVIDDVAIVPFGRNDRGLPKLYGIRLRSSGDVTDTAHLWERDDIGTFVPSPIAYQRRVYIVGDKGKVECLDPESGRTIWTGNFPKHRKRFYASPLIAGGNLYAPREDGVIFTARISNGKLEILAENDMQQPVIGSPIPAFGRLLIRGEEQLFSIAAREAR